MKNTALTSFGQHGYKIQNGAGSIEPSSGLNFVAVTVLAEAALTTESTDTTRFPNLSSVTVPAGATIYGSWSKVTATSGDVIIAYMA
jgi:hypothetical protein|tara:strand:+ start:194 stop:454 length:261 start_codon:yes stop_codon:yes gene_type:complete